MLFRSAASRSPASGLDSPGSVQAPDIGAFAELLPGAAYQFRLRPDGTSCMPWASLQLADLFGVTPADVTEDASALFAAIHPDDHDAVVASILTSAHTLEFWTSEFRIQRPDHPVTWHSARAVPRREPDGSILWHGFVRDITAERALRASTTDLELQLRQAQKVESLGRLAGGVAHDFNNLLTSVMGFATMAKGKLPLGSPAVRDLERVIESAERGAALTQQLLAFARRRIITPEIVHLHGALGKIAPMIRRLLGERVELVLETTSALGAVQIDAGGIEQLIMNLSVNARDAMPQGGRVVIRGANLTLTEEDARALSPLAPLAPGPFVRISVEDSGVGMPPDVLSRVFEPFFTTKPAGEGTGLGLSVCQGIVRQAGGHIAARSEPGEGTTVDIYLPRIVADANIVAPIPVSSSPRGTETLLVVEDDAAILDLIAQALMKLEIGRAHV